MYLLFLQNLLSNEINNAIQSPIGPPGLKGEKGDLGPMGKKVRMSSTKQSLQSKQFILA